MDILGTKFDYWLVPSPRQVFAEQQNISNERLTTASHTMITMETNVFIEDHLDTNKFI